MPGELPGMPSAVASGSWRTATRCWRPSGAVARYALHRGALLARPGGLVRADAPTRREAVDRLTADVLERAGWSEAPRLSGRCP